MREKEAKLAEVKSSYQELTQEFEVHYDMIVKRDSAIEKLHIQLSSAISEREAAESRANLNTQMLTRASERLTNLEKRDEEIKSKLRDIKAEILKIQFETAKVAEAKPVYQQEVSEDELFELRERLDDSSKRKSMTFEIVASINDESRAQISHVQEQNSAELASTQAHLKDLTVRRNELLSAIRACERKMRDEIEQIETQRVDVEETFEQIRGDPEITEIKAELRSLEDDIVNLEAQAEEERAADEQRRSIVQTIKQKLDDRTSITEGDLAKARAILETQKREIEKLAESLEGETARVEALNEEVEIAERGMENKPDFEYMLEQDKQKLNQLFTKKARKQLKAQQRLEEEQKQLDVQIAQQRRSIEQFSETINRCVAEARKRAEFGRSQKKKSKLASIEIKALEGELEGLKQKEDDIIDIPMPDFGIPHRPTHTVITSPPKPAPSKRRASESIDLAEVENLTNQVEKYSQKMDEMRLEMESLVNEEESINAKLISLNNENSALKQDLASFEEIQTYFRMLKARPIPTIQPPKTSKKK